MLNGETRAFRPGLLGDAPGSRAAGAKARLACKEKSPSLVCKKLACATGGYHGEEPSLLPRELPQLSAVTTHISSGYGSLLVTLSTNKSGQRSYDWTFALPQQMDLRKCPFVILRPSGIFQ